MGRNSKWIDSRPGDTGKKVARRALRNRLKRMWHYLVQSVEGPRSETENIHQLRVFSRRAAATMEIFEALLPDGHGRWMRKQVKRVRRASGEARDFDVLMMRWVERLKQDASDDASRLIDEVKERRHDAQRPIEASYEKLTRKQFVKRISKLLARLRDRSPGDACDGDFGCMARVSLARLVRPYLEAGEAPLGDAEALHAFRIQGKQVRYAMEIFAGAFDEDFRVQLYPIVAALQDRLGDINDHVTARAYFAKWHAEADSAAARQALESGMAVEQQAFETCKQQFLAWWTEERRADLRRSFSRYVQLEGPPRQMTQDPPCND